MGFWDFSRPRLEELIGGRWPLVYLGRPANPSPAEGSLAWFKANQEALIKRVFDSQSE
jgi:2-oxoglutarate dehydrogenase complex dehydrogenase (E1) component-like enzyme